MFGIYVLVLFLNFANSQINLSSKCERTAKIVGGIEAEKHEMPFIVSLVRRGGHFCGATIIHKRYILSAGHCICNGLNKFMQPSQIQGVLGLHSISEYQNGIDAAEKGNSAPVKVSFRSIVPHPQYECTSVQHDIALLEFTHPIEFSSHIKPTCLTNDVTLKNNTNGLATVAGWGWTKENQDGERADILRKASVKLWPNSACQKFYQQSGKPSNFISDTQLCAGFEKGGVDSCWADSGGPLLSKDNILIGIVSTGIGCGRPGLPGIYTRASSYIQWIESVIFKK